MVGCAAFQKLLKHIMHGVNLLSQTTVHPSPPPHPSHQTVSLQSFDQRAVRVLVQSEAFRNVAQEVQVFKSGLGLLSFLLGRSPLVRGALQIELEVHAYRAWQNIVHHNNSDVLAATLDAVEAEKFWQQSPGVLVQVLERGIHVTDIERERNREDFKK